MSFINNGWRKMKMCDKCQYGHNNKKDIEQPDHCKCKCHGQGGGIF